MGASSNWAAYVHGGASQKVAKAITARRDQPHRDHARAASGPTCRGGSSQKVAKAITGRERATGTASTAPATVRCATVALVRLDP